MDRALRAQPEILEPTLEHVAERFDLMRDIELETRVVRARFDEGGGTLGRSETDRGDALDGRGSA